MKLGIFVFFGVTLLAASSLFASVTEQESFSYTLDEGGRFSISNVNGSITIVGGKGNAVEIIATKKADDQDDLNDIEIEISHSASEIVVETELGNSGGWFSRGSSGEVRYQVVVPASSVLESVETVNGGISISGVFGNVVAESVNGGLDVSDLTGDVDLSTVNGSISAEFARHQDHQSVKAETVNGRIRVRLPANASVSVNADTMSGRVNAGDFDLEADGGFIGNELNGKIGNGDARMSLETVNGSIKIEKY